MATNIERNYVFVSLTGWQYALLLPSMERAIAEISALAASLAQKKEAAFYKSAVANFTKALTVLKAGKPDPTWPADKPARIRFSHEHYFMVKRAPETTIEALRQAREDKLVDDATFAARMAEEEALLLWLEQVNPRTKTAQAA